MGFFSWLSAGDEQSIMNRYTPECRTVYMLQLDGKPSIQDEGYERFGPVLIRIKKKTPQNIHFIKTGAIL